MKWIPDSATLELSDRNVKALLEKLDDSLSCRSLISPCRRLEVVAVESPGAAEAAVGTHTLPLTRTQLQTLRTEGERIRVAAITVVSVPDAAHYSDRPAGPIYMPGRGEFR